MTTPLYPVNAPVQGLNQGLFPFEVGASVFKEYVQITPFWNFMGMEPTRPIVRYQMKAGEGWKYTVGKLNALDVSKRVFNFDQVSGAGQYQKVDADNVDCRAISYSVPLKGKDLLELGTPVRLPEQVRPQLIEVSQQGFNKDLLDSAMFDYLDPLSEQAGYNPATQLASYDRVVLAGATPTRAQYNGDANLKTAWNRLATGAAYNQNGLSAIHLLNLKAMASRGGNPNGAVLINGKPEDAIRPAYMKTRNGFPMNHYIYLCNTESIKTLYQDPMFYQSTISRGAIVDQANQPEAISGADYHGYFNGIHIYEVKDLSNYISTSQDGNKTVGWELFIGAAAWSISWFKETWIAFKEDTINMTQEYASHEIRGEKMLKFKAKQASSITAGVPTVEQGIIHSFVRLA